MPKRSAPRIERSCLCCGATFFSWPSRVARGKGKFCSIRCRARVIHKPIKHGMGDSSEYTCWQRMRSRCSNPNNADYRNYGGRGISVCAEWQRDFLSFFNYVGKRPSKAHSIDRIDVNGNYQPGNVRWATQTEQQRNRRRHRLVEISGKLVPCAVAAEMLGFSYDTVIQRINRGKPLTDPYDPRRIH